MNNSITQDNQNDNQISKTIKRFFSRFHGTSALKASGAYHKKGTSVSLKGTVPKRWNSLQKLTTMQNMPINLDSVC